MIYSVSQHKNIPVTVTKSYSVIDYGYKYNDIIRYDVFTNENEAEYIGYLELEDTKNGVKVLYIENQHPDLYKHFGQVADQIEVEHCLNRGIDKPNIRSVAAINSHIKHFKRGKRFFKEGINVYLDYLLKNLKKGERVITGDLGLQKMYMPINLINEIKEKIKINPILKGLK